MSPEYYSTTFSYGIYLSSYTPLEPLVPSRMVPGMFQAIKVQVERVAGSVSPVYKLTAVSGSSLLVCKSR